MSSSALDCHVGRRSSHPWTSFQMALDIFASPQFDFARLWKIDLVEVESLKWTAAKIISLYDEAEVKQFDDGDVKRWLDQLKQLLRNAENKIDKYATALLRLKMNSESQLHPDHQIQQVCKPYPPLTPESSGLSLFRSATESEVKGINVQRVERLGLGVRDINKRLKRIALEGIELGLTSSMICPSLRPPMNSSLDRSYAEMLKCLDLRGTKLGLISSMGSPSSRPPMISFLLDRSWEIIVETKSPCEILVSRKTIALKRLYLLNIVNPRTAGSRGLLDRPYRYGTPQMLRIKNLSRLVRSPSVLGKLPADPETNLMISKRGHHSPDCLLDQLDLDSHTFRVIRDVLRNSEEMGLYFSLLVKEMGHLQVLRILKLALSGLRDSELQKLGVPSKQECLDHQLLFEGLGHILEHIGSFVSGQTPLRQRPPQAQRTEAVDIINLIHDNSVALRNMALGLETIGELVRSASSEVNAQIRELEMPEEPQDPVPLVQTYHETVQSKPGKEQPSSMETKINEGSTSKVVNSSKVFERFQNLSENLKRCVFYTSTLFPGDYEFEKDTLIELWIAAGVLHTVPEKLVLRGQEYFEKLHELSIFQMSSIVRKNYDPTTFRVHKDVYELKQLGFPDEYTTMDEGGPAEISPSTMHSTLLLGGNGTDFDSKIFERFYKAEFLKTFKLQIEYGSPIKHVPHILFVKLRFLRVLDLSSTEIKELPTSVCNLTHLRYLDVSGTPIKKLPESVSELYDLQTLKLRDCSNLVGLPKGTSKLINLQHLDLDGLYQLTSMPLGMGQLTNLQKLSIFVVGREPGLRIEELKSMKKLRGSLCIAKMENVTEDQASVAELGDKVAIHSLEFKWSSSHNNGETKFNLIQPHSSIKQLKITRYGATSFPNWLSGENFASLAILHLSYCNCTHLPALGKLCSLESLYINQMHSLKKIGHEFYGGELFHDVAFSKLELLEIDGMPCLEEWEAIQKCEMPKLRELTIIDCPRLVTLPNFMNLKSLQHLRFILCPQIQSFPGEGSPKSLQSLTITECPKLKEQCQKKDGDEWCKIPGIPEIWIDYELQPKISIQAKESESLRGEEEKKGRKEQLERERQELDEMQELSEKNPQFFSVFSAEDIVSATESFNPSLKIGAGASGNVYKGVLRQTPVAIKKFSLHSLEDQSRSGFQREVDVLSMVRHPNLVTLIGVCPEASALVFEYLPNGSLEDRLTCKDCTPPLSWKDRIRIAKEICLALIFLHSNRPYIIVHGDLKPSHILLDVNFVSKFGGFGRATKLIPRDENKLSTAAPYCPDIVEGPFAHIDPEFIETGVLTSKADVYSFGVLLLRLLTGRPAEGIVKEVQSVLDEGKLNAILDTFAGDWPLVQAEQLAQMALRCCEFKAMNRPNLELEVCKLFQSLENEK